MKKIDQFTHVYSLSKTLRFSLIPWGATEKNFDEKKLLLEDEKRAEDYKHVKNLMDDYHKIFIEKVLSQLSIGEIDEYASLYYKTSKTDAENKTMEGLAVKYRKAISKAFTEDEEYKGLFEKNMIQKYLPSILGKDDKDIVSEFDRFNTYFYGFYNNRRNMYTGEGKVTEIAFRVVDQNLPKYLDNCKAFEIAKTVLDPNIIAEYESKVLEKLHVVLGDLINPQYFNSVLSQKEIDTYNQAIGGFSDKDGNKFKGINEYINEYNQVSSVKIPMLKELYKQILSDKTTVSYIPEQFENDNEVITSISEYFKNLNKNLFSKSILDCFEKMRSFKTGGIYIKSGKSLSDLSKVVFDDWSVINRGLDNKYIQEFGEPKSGKEEKFEENKKKYFKKIKSINISNIASAAESIDSRYSECFILDAITNKAKLVIEELDLKYQEAEELLSKSYPENKKLCKSNNDIGVIKSLLDSVKKVQSFLCLFDDAPQEGEKDDVFYGQLSSINSILTGFDLLYNKVRNYITKKPYSNEKIKINFNNPQFLEGWDKNKQSAFGGVILRKDGRYFLAIMPAGNRYVFRDAPLYNNEEDYFEELIYKQISNASQYLSSKQILPQNPPKEIERILKNKNNKEEPLLKRDQEKFIKYVVEEFLPNYGPIHDSNGHPYFDFHFKNPSEYQSKGEFFKDVENQAYSIQFNKIPYSYIKNSTDEGKLYIFQIYCKDFSEYSKGIPNLHTLYFNALFDPRNIQDIVFKLNGKAEMFCRKASINEQDMIVHPKGLSISNKNPHTNKEESTFAYDLIKDRRYTKRQFSLHMPITINYKESAARLFNSKVRMAIKECGSNYIIGIDRGERNLIYICIIDENGKIVEQLSLNDIINSYNGKDHRIAYREMLDAKEKDRLKARQDWTTIENIKELKEGYISQVVHVICKLVEKYDAIIAMEDLNSGFKNSRVKIEKQVYQKFEKMLIDKLNYYSDKTRVQNLPGGVRNAYQLTAPFEGFNKLYSQNGFIFYVPAWLTSKIDPSTGFVNLFKCRYESVAKSKAFFESFDRIEYSKDDGYFEFEFNYDNFRGGSLSYKKEWVLTSQGKRIKTFRNPEHNNMMESVEFDLTSAFKELFNDFGLKYENCNIKEVILSIDQVDFYRRLCRLFSFMVQMRNSMSGTDIDYIISPVKNKDGEFYCSNRCNKDYPLDADANGAYHIALKALWAIKQIKKCPDDQLLKLKLGIKNSEWLKYAQTR